jgi:hypothetical protein
MEFNRLISLVIGFIVLILVFVWIGSRFRSATISQNGAKVTITSTVTPTSTSPTPTSGESKGWNPFAFLFNRNSPTPTPSKVLTVTTTPTQVKQLVDNAQNQGNSSAIYVNNKTGETTTIANSGITRIPETGASTLVIPLAFSALTLGAYLRKRS